MWKIQESGIQTRNGLLNRPEFRTRVSINGKVISGKTRFSIQAARNDKKSLEQLRVPRVTRNRFTKDKTMTLFGTFFSSFQSVMKPRNKTYPSILKNKVLPALGNRDLKGLVFQDFEPLYEACKTQQDVNSLHYALRKYNLHIDMKHKNQEWDFDKYDLYHKEIKRCKERSKNQSKYLLVGDVERVTAEINFIKESKWCRYSSTDRKKAEAFHDFFQISLLVGGRVNEILALRVEDVQGNKIFIQRQIDPSGIERKPKYDSTRDFILFTNAHKLLVELVQKAKKRNTPWLFTYPGPRGNWRRLDYQAAINFWNRIRSSKRVNILENKYSLRCLRTTFGTTYAYQNPEGLKSVEEIKKSLQKMLGHQNILNVERYINFVEELRKTGVILEFINPQNYSDKKHHDAWNLESATNSKSETQFDIKHAEKVIPQAMKSSPVELIKLAFNFGLTSEMILSQIVHLRTLKKFGNDPVSKLAQTDLPADVLKGVLLAMETSLAS